MSGISRVESPTPDWAHRVSTNSTPSLKLDVAIDESGCGLGIAMSTEDPSTRAANEESLAELDSDHPRDDPLSRSSSARVGRTFTLRGLLRRR